MGDAFSVPFILNAESVSSRLVALIYCRGKVQVVQNLKFCDGENKDWPLSYLYLFFAMESISFFCNNLIFPWIFKKINFK